MRWCSSGLMKGWVEPILLHLLCVRTPIARLHMLFVRCICGRDNVALMVYQYSTHATNLAVNSVYYFLACSGFPGQCYFASSPNLLDPLLMFSHMCLLSDQ